MEDRSNKAGNSAVQVSLLLRHSTTMVACWVVVAVSLAALLSSCKPAHERMQLSADDARTIAREAYIYGFPLVESYKTLYKQALDTDSPDYRAPINQIGHAEGVATPEDEWVVTPNTDTPYSFLWADLRAEPIVITMPKIEPERYYTGQLIDLYTHNFAYLGTRAFGNDGGNFLVAGPSWEGDKPDGVRAVIRCETDLFYVLFRTQLFNPSDLDKVKAIQAGISVQPLSRFLGTAAPPPAPLVDWPAPRKGMTETPALFGYLNFLLQFAPVHASEKGLMARFARLGIGAGRSFKLDSLSPEVQQAVEAGIRDVWEKDFTAAMKRVNAGEWGSPELFGTREHLDNNYLFRFMGAKLGLYGNSSEEAIYPPYFADAGGEPLDASRQDYTLRFEKGLLPPAGAFWSLTMYDGKTQLLVANPLERYVLNSPMLDSFQLGQDGSLTLYVQKDSPGPDLESNWLPAPDGPFYCILRIYMPQAAALEGTWQPPPMRAAATSGQLPVTVATAEAEYGLDGVVKNGTVRTRVGELTFEHGYPSRASVEKLYDAMDFQRATQAYIWALPIVSMAEWQAVQEDQFGAKDREIVVYKTTQEKLGILTANATTPYVIAFNDLGRSGPLVIDVPAGPTGGLVDDFWQRPVVDLGLAGPDKGKGGKYLILGPGQEKPEGIAVDYVYESGTMNILYGIRILTPDPVESGRLLQSFRAYPASSPGERQKYAHVKGEWFQYQPRGLKYWERLHAIYEREPVAERDRFMLASLRFLGIEKGKPFNPDARQKDLLEEAALVGEAMAQANSFESRFPGVGYRDDSSWEYVLFLDPSQRVGDHEQLDERAAYTYEAVTTSAGMTTKTPGVGSAYLGGYRDRDGDWLDGSQNYRLTIPPNPPMKQFWSITVYSQATRCLINNGTGRADRSSRHDLVTKADGSVELYFGPGEAPEGMEENFVKTNKGDGFFVYFRLYAPTEPYFDRAWPLPDIEKVGL